MKKKIFSSWLTFFQIYKVWLTIDVCNIVGSLKGKAAAAFLTVTSQRKFTVCNFEIDLFVLRDSKLWWFMKKILKE